jgi:membrane protease YdiL (CAAX protease family)
VTEERPVPSPFGAATLTLLAWALTMVGEALFADVGAAFAVAVGLCIGLGGVGTLAARSVPSPADVRLGLLGFRPAFLVPILLMLPSVVLASEIDNWVRPLFAALPPPEPAQPAPDEEELRLVAIESVITLVLLRPVLEEFFFRGVVQQGLVAHLGALGGVVQTALLSGLTAGGLALVAPGLVASEAAQTAFLGLLLGLLRHTSGSVLASMVAAVGMRVLGFVAVAMASSVPIRGFNTPGPDHTPLAILAPCATLVALGAWLALRYPAGEGSLRGSESKRELS